MIKEWNRKENRRENQKVDKRRERGKSDEDGKRKKI